MGENHSLTDLEARVAKMRELGVVEWGDIKLGPVPAKAEDDEDATQRKLTPEQVEARDRAERRRVASGASGGPVPRLVAK